MDHSGFLGNTGDHKQLLCAGEQPLSSQFSAIRPMTQEGRPLPASALSRSHLRRVFVRPWYGSLPVPMFTQQHLFLL